MPSKCGSLKKEKAKAYSRTSEMTLKSWFAKWLSIKANQHLKSKRLTGIQDLEKERLVPQHSSPLPLNIKEWMLPQMDYSLRCKALYLLFPVEHGLPLAQGCPRLLIVKGNIQWGKSAYLISKNSNLRASKEVILSLKNNAITCLFEPLNLWTSYRYININI